MCLLARVGWEFYSAEDGGTSGRSVSEAGSSKGLKKGPEQTETVNSIGVASQKGKCCVRPVEVLARHVCKGWMKRPSDGVAKLMACRVERSELKASVRSVALTTIVAFQTSSLCHVTAPRWSPLSSRRSREIDVCLFWPLRRSRVMIA